MSAEFQRIVRRNKKAFLSDQWKEIDENNRMGKTRDLFKKTRDTKGTFHAKMSTIKDRNSMGQKEGADIKKRCKNIGSKLGKDNIKAVYCHSANLTYMQGTSCKMSGSMKHKLESTLQGEISINLEMLMTPPLWQKVKN